MCNTEGASNTSCRFLDCDLSGADSSDLSLPGAVFTAVDEMKRALKIFLAIALIVIGLLAVYLYGGSTVPNGQPPLVRLTDSNLSSLKDSFNGSSNSVRVIVMLSPT